MIAIPYKDEQGVVKAVRYRLRLQGDRFRWRQGDRPSLLGLHYLSEWWDAESILLLEGETDTFTAWASGLAALGIPGAACWDGAWWQHLSCFREIVIVPHQDSAGAKLVEELWVTCPRDLRERAFVAQLPDGYKDLNEWWCAFSGDATAFRAELEQLPKRPLSEWREPSESPSAPLLVSLGEILGSEAPALEYVPLLNIPDLLARGTATLLTASPKVGKSTLLMFAAREWARAGLRVAVLTEEPLLLWRLRAEKMPELRQIAISQSAWATPERWVEELERFAPDVAVLDTARQFLGITNEIDPAEVGRAVGMFVELTRRNPRMVLVLCHHLRKTAEREPTVQDVAGAHAFAASVDSILLLTESESNPRQRILHPIAGRLWHNREPLVLELNESGTEYRCIGLAAEIEPQNRVAQWREQVVQAVAALGRATAEGVREFMKQDGHPCSLRWVRTTLAALHSEGVVKREGSGRKGDSFVYYLPEREEEPEPDWGIEEQAINNGIPQFLNRDPQPEDCGSGLRNTSSIPLPQFLNPEEGEKLRNSGIPLINAVPQFLNPEEGGELRNSGIPLYIGTSSIPQSDVELLVSPARVEPSQPAFAPGSSPPAPEEWLSGDALVAALVNEFGGRELIGREWLQAQLERMVLRDGLPPDRVPRILELYDKAQRHNFPSRFIAGFGEIPAGESAWRERLMDAARRQLPNRQGLT